MFVIFPYTFCFFKCQCFLFRFHGRWLLSARTESEGPQGQSGALRGLLGRVTGLWLENPGACDRASAAAAGSGGKGLWPRRAGRWVENWRVQSLTTRVCLQDNTRLDLQRAETLHGDEPETVRRLYPAVQSRETEVSCSFQKLLFQGFSLPRA